MLEESLVGGIVQNQYKITFSDGSIRYIDIIYFKENEITIIELKKDTVIKKHIQQLSEYVEHVKTLFPNKNIRGILAGQQIEANIDHSLNWRGFIFKKYFRDIPFNLKLCNNCRKAVRKSQIKCNWCNCQEFLRLKR